MTLDDVDPDGIAQNLIEETAASATVSSSFVEDMPAFVPDPNRVLKPDLTTGLLPALTFNDDNGSGQATITRASGNWGSDGFAVGQNVVVIGSNLNDGSYLITGLTSTTLTLDTDDVVADEASTGFVEVVVVNRVVSPNSGAQITTADIVDQLGLVDPTADFFGGLSGQTIQFFNVQFRDLCVYNGIINV